MLAYLTTDANIAAGVLKKCLREAVAQSFNCITVDGDMSTNDTVLLLANGPLQRQAEYSRLENVSGCAEPRLP